VPPIQTIEPAVVTENFEPPLSAAVSDDNPSEPTDSKKASTVPAPASRITVVTATQAQLAALREKRSARSKSAKTAQQHQRSQSGDLSTLPGSATAARARKRKLKKPRDESKPPKGARAGGKSAVTGTVAGQPPRQLSSYAYGGSTAPTPSGLSLPSIADASRLNTPQATVVLSPHSLGMLQKPFSKSAGRQLAPLGDGDSGRVRPASQPDLDHADAPVDVEQSIKQELDEMDRRLQKVWFSELMCCRLPLRLILVDFDCCRPCFVSKTRELRWRYGAQSNMESY